MRRLLLPIILLCIFVLTACSNSSTIPPLTTLPTAAPIIVSPSSPTQEELIHHIQQSTVALVISSTATGNIYRPYCAGVWVSSVTILTAAHCIEMEDGEGKQNLIGLQVHYIGYQDVRGQEAEPAAVHLAAVMKYDHKHDLILLVAVGTPSTMPAHQIAQLTPVNIPPMGSTLHTMGQTIGLYWSYSRGYVAGYRNVLPSDYDDEVGPYLQASMPVWHGNSGGGLFNDKGELVAICHTVSTEAPMISFNIAPVTIRKFLGSK